MFLKRVNGLELTIDELLTYLKKSPETKALVLGELEKLKDQKDNNAGPGRGNRKHVDNINMFSEENKPIPKGGNSPTYAMKRLKRDNPELFSQKPMVHGYILKGRETVNRDGKNRNRQRT